MDRADRAGIGIAVAGHVLVFGALSLGLIAAPKPQALMTPPVDIQIVDEIALKDQVPNPSPTPPAPSVAPDVGPPVEDPPPPEPVVTSAPAPVPMPTPAPVPLPKAIVRPTPTRAAKVLPLKPATVKAPPAKPTLKLALAAPAPAAKAQPHGARLGNDFLKGIADRSSVSTASAPRAPVGAQQVASLASAILRQVQPCANRIATPGPGAERILTRLALSMNRDGSFATAPTVVSQTTDEDNVRYAKRVGELAKAAFVQCSPFSLPPDLYDGWKSIVLKYRLPA